MDRCMCGCGWAAEKTRREQVYERALAEIRDITNFVAPCDQLMAAIYRKLGRAMIDAHPEQRPSCPDCTPSVSRG